MRPAALAMAMIATTVVANADAQDTATQLDVFFVLDQSGSIAAAAPICEEADEEGRDCWTLEAETFRSINNKLKNLVGGWADTTVTGGVTVPDSEGLGMAAWTFSCNQTTKDPISFDLTAGNMYYSDLSLLGATNYLLNNLSPEGGTCPSLSLSEALEVALAQPDTRPNRVLVMLTDGELDPTDLNATEIVAQEIAAAEIPVIIVTVGSPGWDEETAVSVFGPGTQIFETDDFDDLLSSVDELSVVIADNAGTVQPSSDSWSSGNSPTVSTSATSTGPVSKTAAITGSLFVTVFVGVIVAGILFIRRNRRSLARGGLTVTHPDANAYSHDKDLEHEIEEDEEEEIVIEDESDRDERDDDDDDDDRRRDRRHRHRRHGR